MFKKTILAVILSILLIPSFAKLPQLSEESKVILYTCGPGEELYALFGHSAIWISDPSQNIDRLYNYGTFDFDTPNFYGKFIRGRLDYILSVYRSKYFFDEYQSSKRSVSGQLLDLNLREKQRIFEFLENNALPENRFYKYDFLWDNCSTRIRDVLSKTTDGKLVFDTGNKNISFREMLFPYLTYTPWTKFGINMILGLTSDRKATPQEYMFLPEYLRVAMDGATIDNNGVKKKLVREEKQYLPDQLNNSNNRWDDPVAVFSLLLLIVISISLFEFRKKKDFRWMDRILFSVSVLAGFFLLFMWVGTDHVATAKNMNILWLLPAQLLFLISLRVKKLKKDKVLLFALGYQLLVSVAMFVWPQDAEFSFLLISLIYVVRIACSLVRSKQQAG
ncbi:MAG TPA: DUF4105 domain-containing protein [Prolixibacteraceae bacterium]|mgnify:CR=1 FL=1|nr:DUF4105 domain-containing protein [Prolixibacteraceae bacterium]